MEDDSVASLEKPMEELLPIALGTAGRIQGAAFGRPLSVSLDSGSATSWFNAESLPKGTHGHTVPQVKGSALAGSFSSSKQVCLQDFAFPEFNSKQTHPKLAANVFHAGCRCDMIISRDILRASGVRLDFEGNCAVTAGVSQPMHPFPEEEDGASPVEQLLHECVESLSEEFCGDEGIVGLQ